VETRKVGEKGDAFGGDLTKQLSEGFATEKISNASFLFCGQKKLWKVRLVDLCLKGKYETSTAQCTQRARISILELDLMVE